jgi:hypothetical protein
VEKMLANNVYGNVQPPPHLEEMHLCLDLPGELLQGEAVGVVRLARHVDHQHHVRHLAIPTFRQHVELAIHEGRWRGIVVV